MDYVVVEDDSFCIEFNVLAEEEFNQVFFENIDIQCNNESIHRITNGINVYNIECNSYNKEITPKNNIFVYKIRFESEKHEIENIMVNIENVNMFRKGNMIDKIGNWDFNIKID